MGRISGSAEIGTCCFRFIYWIFISEFIDFYFFSIYHPSCGYCFVNIKYNHRIDDEKEKRNIDKDFFIIFGKFSNLFKNQIYINFTIIHLHSIFTIFIIFHCTSFHYHNNFAFQQNLSWSIQWTCTNVQFLVPYS